MDKVLEVQRDIRQNAGEVQDFLKVCLFIVIVFGIVQYALETICLVCLSARVVDLDLYGSELIGIAESESVL
jgi:hypothetical protein